MKTRNHERQGFTLIEILTVVTILVVLAGLLLPAINGSIKKAQVSNAREAVRQLATAFDTYYQEFGRWPTNNAVGVSTAYIDFDIRTNLFANTSSITFYDISSKDVISNASGIFIGDPWKAAYKCRLDVGYTGSVANPDPSGVTPVRRSVLIWSLGPDGKTNTPDDIRNW